MTFDIMNRFLKNEPDTDINLILFMFFGLSIGACITFLLNRYSYFGLPYTVGVFVTGAILSVLADHTEFMGDLGKFNCLMNVLLFCFPQRTNNVFIYSLSHTCYDLCRNINSIMGKN
jgi:phosphate starvation-inducible membrane PsiE